MDFSEERIPAGEMALRVRAPGDLPEELGSDPSTHMVAYNPLTHQIQAPPPSFSLLAAADTRLPQGRKNEHSSKIPTNAK